MKRYFDGFPLAQVIPKTIFYCGGKVCRIIPDNWLWSGRRHVYGVNFDIHTFLYAAMAVIIGFQAVSCAVFSKSFAISAGLLPKDNKLNRLFRYVTLEVGLIIGIAFIVIGLGGSIYGGRVWEKSSFGALDPAKTIRMVIPAVLMLMLGGQIILSSFLMSVLGLRRKGSKLQ